MRKFVGPLLLVALAATTAGFEPVRATAEAALPASVEEVAAITFREVVSDDTVTDLLQSHGLDVTSVHMWSNGMTGTRRFYPGGGIAGTTPAEAVANARAASITHLEDALEANIKRLDDLTSVDLPELSSDPESVRRLEALLSSRRRIEKTIANMKGGSELIYGITVTGTEQQLSNLERDARVAEIRRAENRDGASGIPQPSKPSQYEDTAPFTHSEHSDAAELYASAQRIVEGASS